MRGRFLSVGASAPTDKIRGYSTGTFPLTHLVLFVYTNLRNPVGLVADRVGDNFIFASSAAKSLVGT